MMTAIPYFLLTLPLIDLIVSHPDVGNLLLVAWLFCIARRTGWLD